jgi:hypothetical protein
MSEPQLVRRLLVMTEKKRTNKNAYVKLQEEYMDGIHIPDSKAANNIWGLTLYTPLREYLNHVLKSSDLKTKITFVYIGAGPEAPILFESNNRFEIISRIDNLILLDISKRYLSEATCKIKKAFPNLKVGAACIDITGGFGEIFASDLFKLVKKSRSLQEIQENIAELTTYPQHRVNSKIVVTYSRNIDDKLSKVGDIVYSELLATFTGTAALFETEKTILEKYGTKLCFSKEWSLTKAMLHSLWQRYNDIAYLYQLETMSRIVKRNGLIAIATDTEKRFADPTYKSVFSFSGPSFPSHNLPRLVKLNETNRTIWWEDSIRSQSSDLTAQSTIEALLPHKHKIEFETYKCFG